MKYRTHCLAYLALLLLTLQAVPTVNAGTLGKSDERTFTVHLPRAPEYPSDAVMPPDSLKIPDGRPIYALFVHGYTQNGSFNQFLCYNFAKRLREDNAYVHYAWWNNLCAEYMARPLHHATSYPGHLGLLGIINASSDAIFNKAFPVEDYQFQADAKEFLLKIRQNNPSAMIILVGHSMGGAAVARLATDTDVVIDILAPLDPVENRSTPLGNAWDYYYSFTRWRIAHKDGDSEITSLPPVNPVVRTFRDNVIHLYHRYQKEGVPPNDYATDQHFIHNPPPHGTTSQMYASTCARGVDPDAYMGICWGTDGHGELVGFTGMDLLFESWPWALEAQSDWPTGRSAPDSLRRRNLLIAWPDADRNDDWEYRPRDPDLCLVSEGLIDLYESMNRPPIANAGGSRTVEHSTFGVNLDGSASTDRDGDVLSYTWKGPTWELEGCRATVPLGPGAYEITLKVKDPSGHIDLDTIELTVVEKEMPLVTRIVGTHPNPFNITTQVVFELAERQQVTLQVFDLQGRLVQTLEESTLEQGRYDRTWNGLDDTGRAVSSGPYIMRMRLGDRVEFAKVSLIK